MIEYYLEDESLKIISDNTMNKVYLVADMIYYISGFGFWYLILTYNK